MFLATTALTEFWDKDQEILFLGSWCLKYSQKHEWEGLNYQIMPSPWNDRSRFYEACQYLDEYGERIITYLADYLNSVHGTQYSLRYWRILIGPWLTDYLHVFYDKYVCLKEAFKLNSNLQTILLSQEQFTTPRDISEFVNLCCDDPYNLQIFSHLLMEMGYDFPQKTLSEENFSVQSEDINISKTSIRNYARQWLLQLLRLFHRRHFIGLHNVYFTTNDELLLIWKTGFRTLFSQIKDLSLKTIQIQPIWDQKRQSLADLPSSKEFELFFVNSLTKSLPTLYLEGFQQGRLQTLKNNPICPSVLVSSFSGYDESFKFLSAELSEQGTRLVAVQHGGGYGASRYIPAELHESRISDKYWVWGWAKDSSQFNCPAPKVSRAINFNVSTDNRTKTNILMVGTSFLRYLYRFQSTPVSSQWADYYMEQKRFLAALSPAIRAAIIMRLHKYDYGWGNQESLAQSFPNLHFDNWQISFSQRLKFSRLVVIDNLSTTFLEALVSNVPTVLFWDPQRWEVRSEAESYFADLRQVRILWDTPELAAEYVMSVYANPAEWWGSKSVQEVRKRFVDRYALARSDWQDIWAKELRQELKLALKREGPCSTR